MAKEISKSINWFRSYRQMIKLDRHVSLPNGYIMITTGILFLNKRRVLRMDQIVKNYENLSIISQGVYDFLSATCSIKDTLWMPQGIFVLKQKKAAQN